MNVVSITGRIIRMNLRPNVGYLTVYTRDGKHKDYVNITCFNTEFLSRYFQEQMWITIRGRVTRAKKPNGTYETEVVAESIGFAGDIHFTPTEQNQDDFVEITDIEQLDF